MNQVDFSRDRYSDECGLIDQDRETYLKASVSISDYNSIGMQPGVLHGVTIGSGAMVIGVAPVRLIEPSQSPRECAQFGVWQSRPRAY